MKQIIDYLFLGNANDAQNFKELRNNRIKYIINCADDCENYFKQYFHYTNLELVDDNANNLLSIFNNIYGFIKASVSGKQPILIHCVNANTRSVSIVLLFLMKYTNVSLASAISTIKKKNNNVIPKLEYINKLIEYELDSTNVSTYSTNDYWFDTASIVSNKTVNDLKNQYSVINEHNINNIINEQIS